MGAWCRGKRSRLPSGLRAGVGGRVWRSVESGASKTSPRRQPTRSPPLLRRQPTPQDKLHAFRTLSPKVSQVRDHLVCSYDDLPLPAGAEPFRVDEQELARVLADLARPGDGSENEVAGPAPSRAAARETVSGTPEQCCRGQPVTLSCTAAQPATSLLRC